MVVALALAGLLGACGGGEPEASPGSPLSEFMGWTNDLGEQRRRMLEKEEYVARCMRNEGFEYEPFELLAQAPESPDGEPGTAAYGEQYGYGVMRGYEVGEPNSGGGVSFEVIDPNAAYVAGLSGPEQVAYHAVLYGDAATSEDDFGSPPSPLADQGCRGRAESEVNDPNQIDGVGQMLADYRASQAFDPERRGLVREWAACLEPELDALGVDVELTAFNDAHQLIDTELNVAIGNEVVAVETVEQGSQVGGVLYGASDDSGSGWMVVRGDRLRELSGAQIDALTELELAVWHADWSCLDEVGYHDFVRRSEQRLVDQILSEHPELDE